MGDSDRAQRHFESVIDACEREDARSELARSRLHYAMALERARKDPGRAARLRGDAIDSARALGLKAILRRAEETTGE